MQGFQSIEDDLARNDVERVRESVTNEFEKLASYVIDWACWDDTYGFVLDANDEYISSNLTKESFANFGLSFILFFDKEGKAIYVRSYDSQHKKLVEPSPKLLAHFKPDSPLLSVPTIRTIHKGIINLSGKLFLFVAHPILTSKFTGPINGVFVMGKPFDNALRKSLVTATGVDFSLKVPEPTLPPTLHKNNVPVSFAYSKDYIQSKLFFSDYLGHDAFQLLINSPRNVSKLGDKTTVFTLILLLIVGAILASFIIYVLEKHILWRLKTLRERVVLAEGQPSETAIFLDGADELTDLANVISEMRQSIGRQKKFLTEALDSLGVGIVMVDPERRIIVDANHFALSILKVDRESIIGKSCKGFICPDKTDNCPIMTQHKNGYKRTCGIVDSEGNHIPIFKSVRKLEKDGKTMLLESFVDLSELEKTQRELRVSKERYQALFMNTGTATAILADDSSVVFVNPECAKLLGYELSELEAGIMWSKIIDPQSLPQVRKIHRARRVDPASAPKRYESRVVRKDGESRDVMVTVARLPESSEYVVSMVDISEQKAAETKLVFQANHDPLTRLPNRTFLEERLLESFKNSDRTGMLTGVLMLDMDRFKHINDTFGHSLGDQLLVHVADRLQAAVQEQDMVARFGGDEFVIVVENISTVDELVLNAQKIISLFERPIQLRGKSLYIGLTVGVVTYPNDGITPDELIKNADIAMYRAKEMGKNTYAVFSDEMDKGVRQKLHLESELREALAFNQFVVYFQPQIDLEMETVFGVEALVRWQKPDGTLVSPADFIPVAEDTGLISQLDMWVLENSCRAGKIWHQQNLDIRVSVNFSTRLLHQKDIVERVVEILEQTGFPADHLTIEITETTLMYDVTRSLSTIKALREYGVSFSLDDFGTGYSSLSYLRTLPIRTLKIDRSFIKDLGVDDPGAASLVRSIIGLANNLGLGVVAEGVETLEQQEFLVKHKCVRIQGYYYAPPLPEEEALAWIRTFQSDGFQDSPQREVV
ncbi:EAL domain-containing protein [Halodesulfovibrio aestuarii]|uniref:EAL domain-containing protein n=1 Tax=Halodesulfovibrio aestuarii TaxID=126333 RepID=UPI003520095F